MKNHKKFAKYQKINEEEILQHFKRKYEKSHFLHLAFNIFSKKVADIVGNAWSFIIALAIIIIWICVGHYFHYSDTWQLFINTSTTIVTFLVVFLIQNTQNRDTEILNLKIDELIVAKKGAHNRIIDLSSLSDAELKELEKEYIKLCNKRTGK